MKQHIENLKEILIGQDWLKKKKIIQEFANIGIKLDERSLRSTITEFNKNYGNESDFYIAHSSRGYKLTNDKKDIYKSVQDQRKRALKMLKQYYSALDAIGLQSQIALDIEQDKNDLFDIALKGFEGYGK